MTTERLLQDVVKELVELEIEIKNLDARKLLKRSEELRKEIMDLTQEETYTEDLVLTTKEGNQLIFGPRVPHYTITDKKRLKKLIGATKFEELATFTITSLEQVLNKTDLYSVTTMTYGSRRFKEIKENHA